MQKETGLVMAFVAAAFLQFVVYASVVVGVIYVAHHFIAKYW